MNKLIVYFSYTGNTKMIADRIKKELNCDSLEINQEKLLNHMQQMLVG